MFLNKSTTFYFFKKLVRWKKYMYDNKIFYFNAPKIKNIYVSESSNFLFFYVNNKWNSRYSMSIILNDNPLTVHNTFSFYNDLDIKKNKKIIFINRIMYFFFKLNSVANKNFLKNIVIKINKFNGFFFNNFKFFETYMPKFISRDKIINFILKKEFFNPFNKRFKKVRTVRKQRRKIIIKKNPF